MMVTKAIGVKHNEEELAVVEFVKGETKRTASGAYKYALLKYARELGYEPLKRKNSGHPRRNDR